MILKSKKRVYLTDILNTKSKMDKTKTYIYKYIQKHSDIFFPDVKKKDIVLGKNTAFYLYKRRHCDRLPAIRCRPLCRRKSGRCRSENGVSINNSPCFSGVFVLREEGMRRFWKLFHKAVADGHDSARSQFADFF